MAKGAKGKGKAKKGKNSADPHNKSNGDEIDELSKQFYLVQIKDLEEKLARYQQKCDLLTLENKDFQNKHSTEQQDKQAIVAYLRKMTDEKSCEISNLKDEILGIQKKSDHEREQNQTRYMTLKTDMQESIDRLKSENVLLTGQLTSIQDFKNRKEQLEQEYRDLQNNLKEVNDNHQDTLYRIERKQVVDKDRLKKEMINRVNAVATEFRRVSNQQMAETTKRTIQENVAVNSQLVKLTDKTKDLMSENESLHKKLSEQSRKLEMLEKTERELARKNHCSARLISLLTERSNEIETDLTVTEEVLAETRHKVDDLENSSSQQKNLATNFEDLLKEYKSINVKNEQLNDLNNTQAKSIKNLQKIVDRGCVDLTNHLMGIDMNILPNLLGILASASSETIKKAVEMQLGPDHGNLLYENGNLGLVPHKE